MEEKLAELEAQLKLLLDENNKLKSRELERLSKEWRKVYKKLASAVEGGDKLQNKYLNLKQKMKDQGLLIELTQANNPTSEMIGFNLFEVVQRSIISNFQDVFEVEEHKALLLKVVERVVKNPILKAVVSTNPIANVLGNVVESVSNFVTTKIMVGKPKHIANEIRKANLEERLQRFTDSMSIYIDFYQNLNSAADRYKIEKLALQKEVDVYAKEISTFYSDYLTDLNITYLEDQNLLQLKEKTDIPKQITIEGISKVLYDEHLQKGYRKALKYSGFKRKMKDWEKKYQSILHSFLNSYLENLEEAKSNFESGSVDLPTLEKLIKKIEDHIESNKKTNQL